MAARILLVEDDMVIAEVLLAYLGDAGHEVEWCRDGTTAATVWQRWSPDLVVLDLMLPGLSGLELLRRRRREADPAPVIVLSALGEEEDRLVGFETGADDYVVKPFSPREMVLRVDALLRRAERLTAELVPAAPVRVGAVVLDMAAREAHRDGRPLPLTVREFDLLAFLVAHPGQTFSKAELLRRLGVGLRRQLDRHRHRPRPPAAGEGGVRPLRAPAGADGRPRRVPAGPSRGTRRRGRGGHPWLTCWWSSG